MPNEPTPFRWIDTALWTLSVGQKHDENGVRLCIVKKNMAAIYAFRWFVRVSPNFDSSGFFYPLPPNNLNYLNGRVVRFGTENRKVGPDNRAWHFCIFKSINFGRPKN